MEKVKSNAGGGNARLSCRMLNRPVCSRTRGRKYAGTSLVICQPHVKFHLSDHRKGASDQGLAIWPFKARWAMMSSPIRGENLTLASNQNCLGKCKSTVINRLL